MRVRDFKNLCTRAHAHSFKGTLAPPSLAMKETWKSLLKAFEKRKTLLLAQMKLNVLDANRLFKAKNR